MGWNHTTAGQDAQFSQFFATRIYLNPAFAGNTHFGRVSSHLRRQWPALQGYTTTGFYYDQNLPGISSGMAISMLNDRQGPAGLLYSEYNLMYAYKFQITRKINARLGLSGSYSAFKTDLSQFVFTDQMLSGSSETMDDYRFERMRFFDVNTGGLVYSKRYWLGFSVSNLNNFGPNNKNPYPIRYSIHGGAMIPINKNIKGEFHKYLNIATHFKSQQDFDQWDIGAYYGYSVVLVGIWYRGLLALKDNESSVHNLDAFILVAGLNYESFRLSYSYDITASTLSGYSGGAHEVSFQLEIFKNYKYKRRRKSELNVPCPSFGWQTDN